MINKSKDKMFQKYYRLNPNEFLDLLENWRNTCKRQENIIAELIKCIETVNENLSLFQLEQQTILGKTTISLSMNQKIKEIIAKAKKEISKDMTC